MKEFDWISTPLDGLYCSRGYPSFSRIYGPIHWLCIDGSGL